MFRPVRCIFRWIELDWFKAQGPGYQTRINAVLKAFRDASS
jgi:uncharacterized protein (DUF4415 family)